MIFENFDKIAPLKMQNFCSELITNYRTGISYAYSCSPSFLGANPRIKDYYQGKNIKV
jgi:hypothetical protein